MGEKKKKKEAKEKPLEKMTVKELKEIAIDMPEITGAHGMGKSELIVAIKEVRGLADDSPKKKAGSVRELKQKIKELKALKEAALAAEEKEKADIYRRRISRLKKKTRRAA